MHPNNNNDVIYFIKRPRSLKPKPHIMIYIYIYVYPFLVQINQLTTCINEVISGRAQINAKSSNHSCKIVAKDDFVLNWNWFE